MEIPFFFLCTFAGVAATVWWVSRLLLGNGDSARLRDRLRALEEQARPRASSAGRVGSIFERVGQAASQPFMPRSREKQSALRRQLAYAGIYSAATIRTVIGFKFLCLFGGVFGGYALGSLVEQPALGLALGGLLGYCIPAIWLKQRISSQRRQLEIALPDALDLLVVCVEAGLTIDAAMQRVAQELLIAHPPLARELEIAHMETRVGLSRSESLRNLGSRTGSPALQSLAAMLVQAERFGTSIAQSLRTHAESLRVARQHRAEEVAAKASVKLSFPVVLFIFPAVLIILGGPAAIGLFKSALFND